MTSQVDVAIAIRAAGMSVLLDVRAGQLPAIVHWGPDLGELTDADATALALTGVPPVATNVVDEPVRVALLPEHWTGWVGRPGVSGSRSGAAWSPKFTTAAVRIDGQPAVGPDEGRLVRTEGPVSVEVDATDESAELALTVRFEVLTGGLIRAQAQLTNLGADYQLNDCVLVFPVPPIAREILDMAGRWGKERIPQRRPLTVGIHLREGRKGRTGPDAATLLHLGTPGFGFATGEIWAVHTGWSGNHTHFAERLSTGEQVIGGGELLLPGEVVLANGESYTSPWIYAAYGVGLDAVSHRFHRYLRSRDHHPSVRRPVTINVWEAVYFNHDLDQLLKLAELAAELGVERYVLDDGWFGSRRNDQSGLGDWVVSADVWPHGLHPLIDKVNELGLEFGLWFEPEMVNIDSDVARAHPEWVMATGGRLPVESRSQQVINLGIPECYRYVRDAILAMLDEYSIRYIKWDHNRDLIDAGTQPGGRPGVHEQTLAVYRLLDELKAAHPGLEIESCSSGGARVDLGVLERTDRVWVSDCIDPLERQEMHRWTTQLIPPELLGSHIASGRSHTTGRRHDLDFRASTAIFGHLGIEWNITLASAEELEELGAWIRLFKEHRGLLFGGDTIRLDFPDETLTAGGVIAADRRTALYYLVATGRSEVVSLGRIRLPGLAADQRYRIRPLMLDFPPSGLRPPPWWGVSPAAADPPTSGLELSGAILGEVGLMSAQINPDHAVLYFAEAVD